MTIDGLKSKIIEASKEIVPASINGFPIKFEIICEPSLYPCDHEEMIFRYVMLVYPIPDPMTADGAYRIYRGDPLHSASYTDIGINDWLEYIDAQDCDSQGALEHVIEMRMATIHDLVEDVLRWCNKQVMENGNGFD